MIRNVLGTRSLTQILNDRDGISEEMVEALQVRSKLNNKLKFYFCKEFTAFVAVSFIVYLR